MAPDIRKKVDAARALRLAREAEMKQQVAVQVIMICYIFHACSINSRVLGSSDHPSRSRHNQADMG